MTLTLVPEALARPGQGFHFLGANPGDECRGCPFQRICFGLDAGHHYEVREVRDVTHPCALHDEGHVRVVQVAQVPFATSLESRQLRGTAATWTPVPCGKPQCPSYALCHPVGPPAGARYAIAADDGPLPCPAGFVLSRVRLQALAKDAVTGT